MPYTNHCHVIHPTESFRHGIRTLPHPPAGFLSIIFCSFLILQFIAPASATTGALQGIEDLKGSQCISVLYGGFMCRYQSEIRMNKGFRLDYVA